jgi:type II secretion system protein L
LARSTESAGRRVDIYGDTIAPQLTESSAFVINRLSAIKLLAQPLEIADCINLKQKDFLSSRQWSGLIKRWRWPVAALLLLGLVSLAAVVIDSWQKQQQLDQIVQQQQKLLAQHVTDQPISDHPKDQLITLLSQSRGGQGQAGFIDLLYEFSRLRAGFDKLKIDKIVYQKGQLMVNLEAANLNSMEAFRAKLESSRFPGEIDNVSINPDKTTGRLVMKEVQ